MTNETFKRQKEIASDLDLAASRADMIDREPATSKQCWFLAGLLLRNDLGAEYVNCGVCNTSAVLTKGRASREIDVILKNEKTWQAA